MKILQINCVYKNGSTGKIVYDIHKELINNGINSIICYGRGKKIKEKNVYKVSNEFYSKFNNLLSRLTGYMYGGCFFSTNKLLKIIIKERPNIVHIHCINGYFVNIYRLINFLKLKNIKTIITLHAEFMYTANCGHALECEKWKNGCGKCPRFKYETKSLIFDNTDKSWKKMSNAYKNFNNLTIVSVSQWLENRAKMSPMLKDKKNLVILNGLNEKIFKKHNVEELKNKLGFKNKEIILHVTPFFSSNINHLKGGYYVIELAKLIEEKNIQILVIGKHDKNIEVPNNITLIGEISDANELAKYYSMADVTILTSKRETFSMVTIESLCCGTPVVGFKAGGPEQISIKKYSDFVDFGDVSKLYSKVLDFINKGKDVKISDDSIKKYSNKKMVKEYLKLYDVGKN